MNTTIEDNEMLLTPPSRTTTNRLHTTDLLTPSKAAANDDRSRSTTPSRSPAKLIAQPIESGNDPLHLLTTPDSTREPPTTKRKSQSVVLQTPPIVRVVDAKPFESEEYKRFEAQQMEESTPHTMRSWITRFAQHATPTVLGKSTSFTGASPAPFDKSLLNSTVGSPSIASLWSSASKLRSKVNA
jgi:hypothetical protein